ncbi:RICIN domain-containing protein [Streptomyces sp. NPDC029721]|uniref:RICIN domain-containing protein n=1 Tax=Streptomyces sp. NPDC029721 TaxID=3157090 RepID=UPI003409AF89
MRKNTPLRRFLNSSAVCAAGGLMLLPAPAVARPAAPGTPAESIHGVFQIVNLQTDKCATVAGGTSTDNNVPLVQFDCDGDRSRSWRITNWNGESYQIVNRKTAKCMTVAGGTSTENNVKLVQFDCDSHPSRRWRITNWDGESYQIVNQQTDKCATVAGGTLSDNNLELVQFTCDTHPSRRWTLQPG